MIWQRARIALLANVVLAAAAVTARAQDCCAPATQSVCVTEWVAENFTQTRTVYKTQCVQENYTAYRTQCVAEQRTRVCTVNRMVPEMQTVTRTVCESVPCVETRTVMKQVVTCKPVTTVTRKCVDMGHYECQQVPCRQGCLAKLKSKHNSCCCECCCVPMKTVRVWCPNKVWVETPCTKMVRCCECVPTTCQVTVCKMVPKQVTCQVCCYRCVCEQKTECYTVMVPKCVAVQCTRTVAKCVPCQETVTCCRMVPRTVVKQVACCNPCNTCCNPCNTCCNSCCNSCGKKCRHGH